MYVCGAMGYDDAGRIQTRDFRKEHIETDLWTEIKRRRGGNTGQGQTVWRRDGRVRRSEKPIGPIIRTEPEREKAKWTSRTKTDGYAGLEALGIENGIGPAKKRNRRRFRRGNGPKWLVKRRNTKIVAVT